MKYKNKLTWAEVHKLFKQFRRVEVLEDANRDLDKLPPKEQEFILSERKRDLELHEMMFGPKPVRSKKTPEELKAAITFRKYGLTQERLNQMHLAQNGACAICFRKPERLVIDHNHRTGKVRALLCYGCNTAIGKFQESLTVLESAKQYIQKYAEND